MDELRQLASLGMHVGGWHIPTWIEATFAGKSNLPPSIVSMQPDGRFYVLDDRYYVEELGFQGSQDDIHKLY